MNKRRLTVGEWKIVAQKYKQIGTLLREILKISQDTPKTLPLINETRKLQEQLNKSKSRIEDQMFNEQDEKVNVQFFYGEK